nr:ribonuclease H-like domain-containing protein [Tanacetum cinerariifolium]
FDAKSGGLKDQLDLQYLRSQSSIVKPVDRLSLHTSSISHTPKSPFLALEDPHWCNAMYDEYNALVKNASSLALLQQITDSLHSEFGMTDREALNYFLGIFAIRHPTGLFLSQRKYALRLLERDHVVNCNPSRTPVDTESKLGPEGVHVQNPTLYRSLAGGLQYLTFIRLNLSYAIHQICLYMHDPREPHFAALKRILRYVHGTLDFGLHLYASFTISLHTLSRSNAKAEYSGVANVVAETAWFHNLHRELHSSLSSATFEGYLCLGSLVELSEALHPLNQLLRLMRLESPCAESDIAGDTSSTEESSEQGGSYYPLPNPPYNGYALGWEDSNLQTAGPKPVALPLRWKDG